MRFSWCNYLGKHQFHSSKWHYTIVIISYNAPPGINTEGFFWLKKQYIYYTNTHTVGFFFL